MEKNLRVAASDLLANNTRTIKYARRTYTFTVPVATKGSDGWSYPFQWFWDSCFHAIAWSALGETERAKQELDSLLASQEPSGAIYHIRFWDPQRLADYLFSAVDPGRLLENRGFWLPLPGLTPPITTAYTQPPVLAQAVKHIYDRDDDIDYVKRILPKLEKFYRWYIDEFSESDDGLVSIVTQYAGGLDYSPAYDDSIGYRYGQRFPSLNMLGRWVQVVNKFRFRFDTTRILERGPFHQKDVFVNSILIKNLVILAELANVTRETSLTKWANQRAGSALRSLIDKSYDAEAGLFWNLSGKEERSVKVKTIISLMPLIIDGLPKEIAARLVGHLTNSSEFSSLYPVPSVALDEQTFSPDSVVLGRRRIWRGPLSINTNWYLVHGLRQHGFGDIADNIAKKSCSLAEKHGFNEFYNPLTGEPCGASRFGWATLVIDM